MNSTSDSLSFSITDPYQRCLDIAERIIGSLNDQLIIDRYFEQKRKIVDRYNHLTPPNSPSQFDTDRAYQSYQKFVKENRILKEQILKLKEEKPMYLDSPNNAEIAQIIRNLRNEILGSEAKSFPQTKILSAVDEMESLQKAIDAKLDALVFMRENLKAENAILKSELAETHQSLSQRLEAAQEKEQADILELTAAERQLEEEYQASISEKRKLEKQLEESKEENKRLTAQHNQVTAYLKQMEEDSINYQKEIEDAETESENLYKEISKIKNQIAVRTRELNSLQKLGNFGINGKADIGMEIERMKEKAEKLRAENTQMAFELRRIEKRPPQSLDEDELAASILKSKWQ